MKYIVTLNEKQYEVEVEKGKTVATYINKTPAEIESPLPAGEQ